jgi:hypothetical protein
MCPSATLPPRGKAGANKAKAAAPKAAAPKAAPVKKKPAKSAGKAASKAKKRR